MNVFRRILFNQFQLFQIYFFAMPRYEISLITKLLQRHEKVSVLSRVVSHLLDRGHNVRKVQSLGDRCLPLIMKKQTQGSYFVLDTDLPKEEMKELKNFLWMQDEVIRNTILPHHLVHPPNEDCCGDEEVDYAEKLESFNKFAEKKPSTNNIHSDIVPFPL